MKFDARVFEDLSMRLVFLGELFSSRYPQKSKNPALSQVIQEARVHAFLSCHTSFRHLLESMYELSGLKSDSSQQDSIGTIFGLFLRGKLITQEQLKVFVEQFESGYVLSFDRAWAPTPEEAQLFDQHAAKIARYYYTMNQCIGALSRTMSFSKKGIEDEKSR